MRISDWSSDVCSSDLGWRIVSVEDAARQIAEIDELIAPNLTDDRVFGVMSHARITDFYEAESLAALAAEIDIAEVPVLVVGWGAALLEPLVAGRERDRKSTRLNSSH